MLGLTSPRLAVASAPPANIRRPSPRIFRAALRSRSWCVPQWAQVHVRTSSGILSQIEPHTEHVLELGYHRSHLTNALPARAALYSKNSTNMLHPASPVAFARRWFDMIPFTCKSSTAITWFSFTIRRDSLWRLSLLAHATRSCTRATSCRAFSRPFDPFFLRESLRCFRFRFFSAFRRRRGFSNFDPSLVTAR